MDPVYTAHVRGLIEKAAIENAELEPDIDSTHYCETCGTVGKCHPDTGYCFVCNSDDWKRHEYAVADMHSLEGLPEYIRPYTHHDGIEVQSECPNCDQQHKVIIMDVAAFLVDTSRFSIQQVCHSCDFPYLLEGELRTWTAR